MNIFKTYLVPAILIVLFLCLFILLKYIFIIKNINCTAGGGNPCPQSVISVLTKNLGSSLLTLNKDSLDNDIKQEASISKLKIEKKFPASLNLEITLETFQIPIKFLNQDIVKIEESRLPNQSKTRTILLENGQTLTAKDETDTNIFINQSLKEDSLKQISFFLKTVSAQSFKFNSLFAQDDTLYIRTATQTIILPINHDPQTFISSLHSIQEDVTIKTVKIIDFRYKHPILK